MQRSAKRGTAGTLLALGLYYKELSAVVGRAVHFTELQHQAHVTPVLPLPGFHGSLVCFERDVLSSVAGTVFSLVPLHLMNIFVGLLCANHVTHRFGKGITPARYRLTAQDILLSSVGSAAAASSSAVDKQGVMKQTDLPVPPFPAPKGHSTFREDRESMTTYRQHARAKSEFGREV